MTTKVQYGKPVKLLVDYQGYPEGRAVKFEVFQKKALGEEKVAELFGATRRGKACTYWHPNFSEYKVTLTDNASTIKPVEDVKYYFTAKLDDKEVKSTDIEFTCSLDIYLKVADGAPLDGLDCKVTLSDGSTREVKFVDGHLALNDVPRGKFKLEIDGYTPNTLHGGVT
jgi:hypothetical protein